MTPEQFTQLLETMRQINGSIQFSGVIVSITLVLILIWTPRK